MKTQQKIFMNRELSWLKFNERVLEEAENREVPLCERLTFASIYQSNLDEFFMVRVGSLIDQMLLDKNMKENKTKMTPQEQIDAIIPQVQKLNRRKDSVYEEMMDSLKEHNIHLVNFQKISKKESEYLRAYFQAEIAPLISPTIIGKRQPFPFLKNKEIYAVAVLETKNGKEKLGIIPCGNETFDRLINISGKDAYMLSEEMILHYVPRIFKGYHVKAKTLIRITRNADIDADSMYDEDLDYRDFMVELIKKRKKLAPVRMELSREMDGEIIDLLCEYLELERKYVFYTQTPLDLSFVFKIQDILRRETDLFFEKRVPQRSPQFNEEMPIMDQIEKEDKLLSYPYESMRPFLKMLQEAAEDKDVVSIKMTLYRVAKQSKIIASLIEAAENGKDVTILVELKARFDEENNIEWSRQLEDAGCRVIYGLDGYKVHSKLCLIHDLTQSFENLWVNECNWKTANNDDVMFAVPMLKSVTSRYGYNIGVTIAEGKHSYGSARNYVTFCGTYVYSFDKDDLRRDMTCVPYKYDKDLNQEIDMGVTGMGVGKWSKLYMQSPLGASSGSNTGINSVRMRFADVLLMYAEAVNELYGPRDDAKEALKRVRRRAFDAAQWTDKVESYVESLTNEADFFQAVMDERKWEFGGEGIRKYDLARWNKYGEVIYNLYNEMTNWGLVANGAYVPGIEKVPSNIYYKQVTDPEHSDRKVLDIVGIDEYGRGVGRPAGYTALE